MPDKLGRFMPGEHWRQPQVFRERAWLEREYIEKQRSAGDIAVEFQVTDAAVLFWLRKHGIPRRTISQTRQIKHWGSDGEKNPMWGKRGIEAPSWKGGVTPVRQKLYSSTEWKNAAELVRRRDAGRCRRCWRTGNHVHHIVPFSNETLRTEPYNLVLLCVGCHRFVHSPRNTDRVFRADTR